MPFPSAIIVPALELTNTGDSPFALETYVDPTSGLNCAKVRLYNDSGGAMTVGQIAVLTFGGGAAKPYAVKTVTSVSAFIQKVVVALEATANAAWGWFAWEGVLNCLVEGTTAVSAQDYLRVVTATSATGFIKEATGTTPTAATHARAMAAQGSAGAISTQVVLFPFPATVG